MKLDNVVTAEFLEKFTILIYEPFSDFLLGSDQEKNFPISLLDVVRFAGHACPSMVGAFLITRAAIENLYPVTKVCVRGDIEIDIPNDAMDGATGPIANVFSYITGAWGDTGFGGFQGGNYTRRHLLHFQSKNTQAGAFRFTRRDTGAFVDIIYQPKLVKLELEPAMSFQLQWRHKIKAIIENSEMVIQVINSGKYQQNS